MPSEREIDNYIDSMEEENAIYVDKELEYAEKYHKLEEQVGCPLDVRCNVVCDSYIYDENGIQYKVAYIAKEHFDCEDPFDNDMGYTKLCAFDWKDYKKTFWLREDKSE